MTENSDVDTDGGAPDDAAVVVESAAMAEADAGENALDANVDDNEVAAERVAMVDKEEDEEDPANPGNGPVLDQDEIDSLLGFDDGDDDDYERTGIQAIVNSALVSYERLPMLEVVFDRLIRMMSTSLRNFTSDNVEVSLDNITSIRFGDYLNSIPLPAMLSVFRAEEWDNYGLMTVDSALIYSIVDVLLGGRRDTAAMRIEGRPYTTIEIGLVSQLVEVVLENMSAAFEPISPVRFGLDRLETNPRFATIARPANAAVLIKLRIDMEERGGRLELLLPYATLEPVREILLETFMGEKFGRDSVWECHLATELWHTEVDIEAVLEQQTMTLNQVMNWEVGTTLMLNSKPESIVELRCGGIALLSGRMGRLGQSIAIRVEDRAKQGQ